MRKTVVWPLWSIFSNGGNVFLSDQYEMKNLCSQHAKDNKKFTDDDDDDGGQRTQSDANSSYGLRPGELIKGQDWAVHCNGEYLHVRREFQ